MITTFEATGVIFAIDRGLNEFVEGFLGAVDSFLVHHKLVETAILKSMIKKLLVAGIQSIEGLVQS